MSYFEAIILGLVQGLAEFLPISSTGHMIIADEFIHLEPAFKEMFFVVIQLGSIFAVLVYFHKKLFRWRRSGTRRCFNRRCVSGARRRSE